MGVVWSEEERGEMRAWGDADRGVYERWDARKEGELNRSKKRGDESVRDAALRVYKRWDARKEGEKWSERRTGDERVRRCYRKSMWSMRRQEGNWIWIRGKNCEMRVWGDATGMVYEKCDSRKEGELNGIEKRGDERVWRMLPEEYIRYGKPWRKGRSMEAKNGKKRE